MLELIRLTPNETRARELAGRLSAFDAVTMPQDVWSRARQVQLAMAGSGDHRRVPPANLMIAATAERAGVPLVHYDQDYERIAAVTRQPHLWSSRTARWHRRDSERRQPTSLATFRVHGGDAFSSSSQVFLCPWDFKEGDFEDDGGLPAAAVRLDEAIQVPGEILSYAYDYGDNWVLQAAFGWMDSHLWRFSLRSARNSRRAHYRCSRSGPSRMNRRSTRH